jgi:hypothetical protein
MTNNRKSAEAAYDRAKALGFKDAQVHPLERDALVSLRRFVDQ